MKVASNTFWQVISRIITSGSSFIVTILIAHTLGVGGYGDLAKITAFVSLFYLGVDLGLNAVFLQLATAEKHFSQLLSFRLLAALLLLTLVVLFTIFLPYNSVLDIGYSPLVKTGIIFFCLTFLSRAIVFSTAAVFQKGYAYKFTSLSAVVGSLTTLIFTAFVLWIRLPFLWVIGGFIIGSFAEAFVSLFFVTEKKNLSSFDMPFIKTMVMQTLPITMMLFLNLVYFRVDMLLLTLYKPTLDVAIYDFAYKFFDFLIALPLFLSNSIYPMLLASGKNTRIALPKLTFYTVGFGLLGLLVALFVWWFTPLLGFVKIELSASSFVLRLLLLSLPIFFATNILQWLFIAQKKQAMLVYVYGTFLVINILLNVLFIPQYSYIASAIITGVSEAGILLVLLFLAFFI